jgi:cytochrome c-type biogenesis protein CcsB
MRDRHSAFKALYFIERGWTVKGFRRVLKHFFSYPFIVAMLFILGSGAAVATFIESMYDTQSAKIAVYDALWYEVAMVLLSVSMIGLMIQSRMWTRKGAFFIHAAFVLILVGAGLTRYFGYEGVVHIREGMSENEMISVKSYLHVQTPRGLLEYPLSLSQIGNNDFSFKEIINGKTLHVRYKGYRAAPKGKAGTLYLIVTYDGESQNVMVEGGSGWIEPPAQLRLGGMDIEVAWGSKVIELPFALKLVDFQLERYPGSMSPSSYASEIKVEDTALPKSMAYRIFMNHPLHYKGYTFFQSSYDEDEKGTVLEVNKDPGKWPTYLGYALLCFGFLLNFFTKGSRFMRLRSFLQKHALLWFVPFLLGTGVSLKAQEEYLDLFRKNSLEHAKNRFSTLLVQDYQGRIKPMSTEAVEIVGKLSSKSSLYGLSSEQIVLGMVTNPSFWERVALIKLSNASIKEILKLDAKTEYVSFEQAFDENGNYRLAAVVAEANRKAPSQRSTLDNEVIKFDEKLNIAYLTFKGIFFKFVPLPNDLHAPWLDPNTAFSHPMIERLIKKTLNDYFVGLQTGIADNRWEEANQALQTLQENQYALAGAILPSSTQVKAEVLYNHLSLFKQLISGYSLVGFAALLAAFASLFAGQKIPRIEKGIWLVFIVCFALHTFALGLRWYVSAHAPWSDSYESLVYIGWSAALAGIVVFRRSTLALAASAILASIVMLVAHLSFINPQITNLVPVLKSYWLSIHVSVITASYGFLGLGALLGAMALLLMVVKTQKNTARLNDQIRILSAINEISLIIGLSLLTVGNFFGGIWANESWGRYWGWDPKETWSFVSIIVYALILHLRFIPRLHSIYVFNVASLLGFSSIIMTYFGVNYYLTGMHSYAASGEHPALPIFVYYVLVGVCVLCAAAYKGREVKPI